MIERRLILLVVLLAVTGYARSSDAELIDDLQAHLDLFVLTSFPGGELSYTTSEYETISSGSNVDDLAQLIALNTWVINESVSDVSGVRQTSFVQLQCDSTAARGAFCPEMELYIEEGLKPKMVEGALVAEVVWTWGEEEITTYALVNPDHEGSGDTENIIDGIAGFYTTLMDESQRAPNPFKKTFKDGFGFKAAEYTAELTCPNGDTCSGDSECWERGPLMGCQTRKNVKCLANGNCQMDVAFVGYGGFPSVSFDSGTYSFSVGSYGWQYYNASITLDKACNCTPEPEGTPTLPEWGVVVMAMLLLTAGTMIFLRIRGEDGAVR